MRIASRGSRLALRQAESIGELVARANPGIDVEIVTVKTRGDEDRRPFAEIGGKGIFMAEVERAVVDGRADVAVHSAKDLTSELAPGTHLACVPRREVAYDVIVGGTGAAGEQRLASLPEGARVGTSSMRRRALLAEARADLEVVELRGNLDTRLRKVADGEVDAAVLAGAGIARLDVAAQADPAPLDPAWWIPAPGQGCLALQTLTERDDITRLLEPLDHPPSHLALVAERAFSTALEGGCSVPLGALASVDGTGMVVGGYLGHPDGTESYRDLISGGTGEAASLGRELAAAILAGGGGDLMAYLQGGTP